MIPLHMHRMSNQTFDALPFDIRFIHFDVFWEAMTIQWTGTDVQQILEAADFVIGGIDFTGNYW